MGEERTGQPDADRSATERPTTHLRRRLTVSQAAEELGISAEAVRSRVKRGTLQSTKEGGTVYVLFTTAPTRPDQDQTTTERDQANDQAAPEHDRAGDQAALVESLLEQVSYMREQLEAERRAHAESRRIAYTLAQRVPELEAASTPRESPESATDRPEGTEAPADVASSQEATEGRSWWRRIFGG